jgi:hypothetical protein
MASCTVTFTFRVGETVLVLVAWVVPKAGIAARASIIQARIVNDRFFIFSPFERVSNTLSKGTLVAIVDKIDNHIHFN